VVPCYTVVQDIVRLDLTLSQKDMLLFSFDYRPLAKMALPNLQELVITGTGDVRVSSLSSLSVILHDHLVFHRTRPSFFYN